MSVSAPKIPPSKTGEESETKAPWIGLSVLFHVLVLGGLIYLVPVKELISPEGSESEAQNPAAAAASPDLVREVSEQIEKTQADEVRAKVEELQATEKMMAELQDQKTSEFSNMAKELSSDAPKQAADVQAAAAQAQAEAEQAQAEAKAAADELHKAMEAAAQPQPQTADTANQPEQGNVSDLKAKVSAAQDKAKAAQTKARAAQTEAAQQLGFLDNPNMEQAKAAQTEAANAQEEANKAQDQASAQIGALNAQERAYKQAQQASETAQKQADAVKTRNEQVKQGIATQEENLGKQKENLENLKQRPDAAKPAISQQIKKSEDAVKAAETRLQKTKDDLAKSESRQSDLQAKADSAKNEAENAQKQTADIPTQLKSIQEEALSAQQKATVAQNKAQETLAQAASASSTQSATAPNAPKEELQQESLEGKNFAQLYKTAVETEKKIAEKYRNVRATQVAVQRKIPLAEAQKYVEIATPVRAEFKGTDPSKVADAAALEKQNAAIETANQELDSMVALSRNMAFQANNSGGNGNAQGMNVTLADMKAEADQADQLAEMATESENGETAVDLTSLMKQMEGDQTQKDGEQSAAEMQPHEHGPGNQPPTAGGDGNTNGKDKRSGGGVGGFPGMENVRQSVPGRKVHANSYGSGDKWMFLDTWYIIGPFPNPQRRNLDTKFPPESIVDLDATYQSEGNTLRWQFVQSSNAAIHPPLERPYAIYYAYTTLWFDEARDMWTATGSDDFSKVWINDMLVWASGSVQKNWKPDEGFRKVHFKKGLNRVLVRLENGHNACLFSFMLNMQTEAPK